MTKKIIIKIMEKELHNFYTSLNPYEVFDEKKWKDTIETIIYNVIKLISTDILKKDKFISDFVDSYTELSILDGVSEELSKEIANVFANFINTIDSKYYKKDKELKEIISEFVSKNFM